MSGNVLSIFKLPLHKFPVLIFVCAGMGAISYNKVNHIIVYTFG